MRKPKCKNNRLLLHRAGDKLCLNGKEFPLKSWFCLQYSGQMCHTFCISGWLDVKPLSEHTSQTLLLLLYFTLIQSDSSCSLCLLNSTGIFAWSDAASNKLYTPWTKSGKADGIFELISYSLLQRNVSRTAPCYKILMRCNTRLTIWRNRETHSEPEAQWIKAGDQYI